MMKIINDNLELILATSIFIACGFWSVSLAHDPAYEMAIQDEAIKSLIIETGR